VKFPIPWKAKVLWVALLSLWGGPAAISLLAQEPPEAPPSAPASTAPAPAAQPGSSLSPEAIETRIQGIEAQAGLDELTKRTLLDRYREALASLEEARGFREVAEGFREALESGPEEIRRLREALQAARAVADEAVDPEASLGESPGREDLEEAIARRQATLGALRAEREALEQRIEAGRTRPDQVRERLVAARAELGALVASLADAPESETEADLANGGRSADLARQRARLARLEAEVAMLEQEDLSAETRSAAAQLSRELSDLRIAEEQRHLEALHSLARAHLRDQGTVAGDLLRRLRQEAGDDPPAALAEALGSLDSLIEETRRVSGAVDDVGELHGEREEELLRIQTAFEEARQQSEFGDSDGALAAILIEQLRSLPTARDAQQRLAALAAQATTARAGLFELERRQRRGSVRAAATAPSGRGLPPIPEAWREPFEEAESQAVLLRAELAAGYGRWIRALGQADLTERRIQAESAAFREFAMERLFWVRSAPAIGLRTFALLPAGLAYCYGPERWRDLTAAFAAIPAIRYLAMGILAAVLLLLRRPLRRWLHDAGVKTRRIRTARYAHTATAFVATLLLAAPLPLILAILGRAVAGEASASDWIYGLGMALRSSAWFLFQFFLLVELCRKGGLAEAHFGWAEEGLLPVRRYAWWLLPAYLPAMVTLTFVYHESSVAYLNGLGRIAGLVFVLGMGTVVAAMLHPERGVAAAVHRRTPQAYFGRMRGFWFALVVAVATGLAILLLAGYLFTSLLLIDEGQKNLSAVFAAFLAYGMVLRWFSIKERKLALEEALEQRRVRLEAARKEEEGEMESELQSDDGRIPRVEEEEEMDLALVGEQTRRLIGFLVGMGLAVYLWTVWTGFDPILKALDRFDAGGGFSVRDVAVVALVIAVTVATMRNLPGLLEMLVLRRLNIDAGTRNAYVTLGKYAVVAAGAVFLFRNLGVDWSQFGWIAAALSVGLGFGLQEVVANFVSGIILLFERPIRVGDIVTVNGIDGVVSRIQIRATTITDWNRKEFIVPNKQFVTGTVLNWTLSNPINRVTVPVGVAYGADTVRARELLLEVARDHPLVLDDPGPIASFEEFADSSLKLVLRCFLPNLDNRLATVTDLHSEIDRRFKEAGIEIAFPQMDLHLRDVPADAGTPKIV